MGAYFVYPCAERPRGREPRLTTPHPAEPLHAKSPNGQKPSPIGMVVATLLSMHSKAQCGFYPRL